MATPKVNGVDENESSAVNKIIKYRMEQASGFINETKAKGLSIFTGYFGQSGETTQASFNG